MLVNFLTTFDQLPFFTELYGSVHKHTIHTKNIKKGPKKTKRWNVLSSKYTRDQVARTADEALRRVAQHDRTNLQTELTYDDAREADECQYESHVGFSGGDAAARFERIDGLSAAQDPREQQALQQSERSIQYTACGWMLEITHVGHYPREQHLRNKKVKRQRRAQEDGKGTYIRAHASVVLPRGLFFLCVMHAGRVGPYHGRAVLEVVGRFVVEGISICFFCDHLYVYAGL